MSISKAAFFDELEKISSDDRKPLTKEKLRRALQAGLVAAGGVGIGSGLSAIVGHKFFPALADRFLPNPTAGQLQKMIMAAGAIGSFGSLASDEMKRLALEHAEHGSKKPENRLMGHEALNADAYKKPLTRHEEMFGPGPELEEKPFGA